MPSPTYSILETVAFSLYLNIRFCCYSSMAVPKNTFLCIVTLTCLLLKGSYETTKKYKQNQLWHANVVGHERIDIDNVRADDFLTSITFWEQNVELHPVAGCVAVVVGEAAFVLSKPVDDTPIELSLKVYASQVCV